MDKEARDRIKNALLKLARNPFFLYAPAIVGPSGERPVVLEFLLTAALRDARAIELRSTYGDKIVKGRAVEEGDAIAFYPVRKPTRQFPLDLKKLGQLITALAGAKIVDPSDDDDDDDAPRPEKPSAKPTAEAREPVREDEGDDDDDALRDRVKRAAAALDAASEKVEKHGSRIARLAARTDLGDGLATRVGAAETLVRRARDEVEEAHRQRARAKTRAEHVAFTRLVATLVDTVNQLTTEVRQLSEAAASSPEVLRRVKALEEEVASWRTGAALLDEELTGIERSGTLDAATVRRAEELFALLDARLAEAEESLTKALAELEV